MKAQGIVGYVLVLVMVVVLVVVAVICVIAIISSGDAPKMETVTTNAAILGQKLVFPKGYHLAAYSSYAYQATGPYTTYICQSDIDPTDYRVCSPKEMSAE